MAETTTGPNYTTRYIYRKRYLRLGAALFDAAGWAMRRLIRPSYDRLSLPPERIAFIRLDGIGDVMAAMPAVKALKDTFPSARLTMIVQHRVRELPRSLPFVDEVITLPCDLYSSSASFVRSLSCTLRLKKVLLANRFDVAVDPRGDPRIILAMHRAKIPLRIGVNSAGGAFWLTRSTGYSRSLPEVEHNLDVVSLLGAKGHPEYPHLQGEPDAWRSLLSAFPLLSRPFFVVHPSATMQTKLWPAKRFASVIDHVAKRTRLLPVLIGAADTMKVARAVVEAAKTPTLSLAGRTSLGQLIALLAHSALFLGNDSGPAHIAAATRCPTAIIFSGTNDPKVWKPPGHNVRAIWHYVECSPCERRFCRNPRCLLGITVQDVTTTIDQLISLAQPGRPHKCNGKKSSASK